MRKSWLALAAVVTIVFVAFALRSHPAEPPPVLQQLPEFALTERDGSVVSLHDLAGRPWIADFIFTRCAIYCPRMTARMKELRLKLPAGFRTVSFSVDPEHDTPEVLTSYAKQWQVEGRDWLFLTGRQEPMWKLIREGFLMPVEAQPEVEGSPVLHSTHFVLVDGAGRVRGSYDPYDDAALGQLLRDLRAVTAEEGG
jgi:cytochrome oxidase Cu insertion factor (SCO1/SenC/PrrC family)